MPHQIFWTWFRKVWIKVGSEKPYLNPGWRKDGKWLIMVKKWFSKSGHTGCPQGTPRGTPGGEMIRSSQKQSRYFPLIVQSRHKAPGTNGAKYWSTPVFQDFNWKQPENSLLTAPGAASCSRHSLSMQHALVTASHIRYSPRLKTGTKLCFNFAGLCLY